MQLTLHVKRFIKFSTLEKDRLKQNVPKARAHHIELNRQTGISGIAQNCRWCEYWIVISKDINTQSCQVSCKVTTVFPYEHRKPTTKLSLCSARVINWGRSDMIPLPESSNWISIFFFFFYITRVYIRPTYPKGIASCIYLSHVLLVCLPNPYPNPRHGLLMYLVFT